MPSTSLAFGRGASGPQSVFIANSALFGPLTNGPGSGVVQVGVGVRGLPFQIDEPVPDPMTLFVGEFAYVADPDEGFVSCLDPTGNSVPGLVLPKKANVDGRASHLDKTTGYFTTSECQAQADGILTSAGDWMFIGADGHRVMGTWTATTLADGSLTGKTVITGGIGKFAEATSWTRFAGQIDLTTGTGRFYGKGLISPPTEVVEMGFVNEVTAISESGSIPCFYRNGNFVISGTRRFEAVGLATYLGQVEAVMVNERCTGDGVLTFYGTWTYTNAQGDGLRGMHAVVVGVGETWPNDSIITGGTGRFEGATGWMKGTIDPRIGIWVGELEGVIFLPR